MAFLTVHERFRVLTTQKGMAKLEPLAREFSSYCQECRQCLHGASHLCTRNAQCVSKNFWKSLLHYSGIGELRVLQVAACKSFHSSVIQLASSQNALRFLQVLDLNRCCHLKLDGMMALASACENLCELRFRDMSIDNKVLRLFLDKNCHSLRVLHFWGCHTMDDEVFQNAALCSKLTDLCLWGCHSVNNRTLILIAERCTKLVRLNLRYCHHVDDKVVSAIAERLPDLRDLNLRYCYKISDRAVEMICSSLIHLEILNLSQCSLITDAAIRDIAASLRELKELRLWGCAKLTAASVLAITVSLPSLHLIDIRSRDKLEAMIGGQNSFKYIIHTCRDKLTHWEQAGEIGVFRRLAACSPIA